MPKQGQIVNKRGLSEIFGISVQGIDGWLARGCPYLEKGAPLVGYKFDTAAVVEWRSQQAVSDAIASNPGADESDADNRLITAQATLAELKLFRELGQHVTLDDVSRVWSQLLASCKARILSVPSKTAAASRASATNEIARSIIEAALREALDELNSEGFDEPDSDARATEARGESEGDINLSCETEPERVGRQPTQAKSRGKRGTGAVDNGAR